VVPEAEAERISPELVWLRIRTAFDPIPPETDRGAGVRVASAPMFTPESKSETKTSSPVPLAESVRLSFDAVVRIDAPPLPNVTVPAAPPRLRVVAAPKALMVVAVVLNTSKDEEPVIILVVMVGEVPKTDTPEPVSSVRVLRSTDDNPEYTRFLLASVSANLEAVASARFTLPEPASITMSPVVEPPRVRVWALVVPRLPPPVKKAALFPEFADIEAVGVNAPVMFRTANFAEAVVVPPIRRSMVEFMGVSALPSAEVVHQLVPVR